MYECAVCEAKYSTIIPATNLNKYHYGESANFSDQCYFSGPENSTEQMIEQGFVRESVGFSTVLLIIAIWISFFIYKEVFFLFPIKTKES